VASFGDNLRQARKARNITLQEIAATTKISSRALQALEEEHFEQLPGGIFNKGFVRAYARCVGLDEENTIADYLLAAKVSPTEIDMEVISRQVAAAAAAKRQPWAPNAASVVGVLAVLVALGMGALWLNEHRKEAREQAEQRQAENAASVPAPVATPPAQTATTSEPNPASQSAANGGESNPNPGANKSANQDGAPHLPQSADVGLAKAGTASGTASSATPSPSTAPSTAQPTASKPPQSTTQTAKPATATPAPTSTPVPVASRTGSAGQAPVEVSLSATSRVWVSVQSDGKTVETLTLDPEKPELSHLSDSAKEKLLLVVGNPAGLSVTYNGKPARALGAGGERAIFTFTPEGMEKHPVPPPAPAPAPEANPN
jgi:cytoskeletal protein RodZ